MNDETTTAVAEAPSTHEMNGTSKPRGDRTINRLKARLKAVKSGKKSPAKSKKADTAPKRKPMPDGKSVHSSEPTREPNWNARRIAVVKAMRSLGATGAMSAATPEKIAAKAGKPDGIVLADRVDLVKIILDVYRTGELIHNGFAASVKHEGERGLRYYLTKKGRSTTFPEKKSKKAE